MDQPSSLSSLSRLERLERIPSLMLLFRLLLCPYEFPCPSPLVAEFRHIETAFQACTPNPPVGRDAVDYTLPPSEIGIDDFLAI